MKVYLQCNRKATETGDILHMHRNTVLYHIDRIEQLLHISLSSADVCLKLQLGIKTFESNMSEILL
ncbi:MAG TPA: helix-turn-helix domain-containing protein [Candidatus Eubacterium avistercoris]|uniref:Helix-turn-helix domain-containing protein n=1 Tax=Candidatus Eubacterium avistercoris TaxID=2838567 RepID=A0A9D2D1N7_9FIRM|nr:helix-turn-helix domain-containing protein [Candidatus Eubacterium avistercoris]HIZ56507.1 helix-turn-helix domain-containing protein [Bacillota bacterium]